MSSKKTNPIIHFIGIGGIGMSALARYFIAKKRLVSGSDIAESEITRELQKKGVKVKIGHKKANLSSKTELVIYSQAIPATNPELKEAREKGIKTLSYPEAIGELTRQYKTIAVAGAHGKSTTTALVSLILIKAGLDPMVIVGTKIKEFNDMNFRFFKFTPQDVKMLKTRFLTNKYFVLEADEYGGAFLHYSPTYAIITNIDREHLDYYKSFSNIKKSFLGFIKNIKQGGALIINRDDPYLYQLKKQIEKISHESQVKVIWYSVTLSPRSRVTCNKIKNIIQIPGKHNVSNACAAYTLARVLGIKEKTILKAISRYHGAWRRMEYRGKLKLEIGNCPPEADPPSAEKLEIPVFDDYAHHPTEIKATLAAFKEKFPNKKIICVFQPHQAERLKFLFKDYVNAFGLADILVLLPIYRVPGRDQKIYKKFTSQALAEAISKKQSHPHVVFLQNPHRLPKLLKTLVAKPYTPSPVIVMMGAGDIVNYTNLLLSSYNIGKF